MANEGRARRGRKAAWPGVVAVLLLTLTLAGCLLNRPTPQPTSVPASQPAQPYGPWIYGGLPKTSEHLTILKNDGYMVGYSEEHNDPAWVAYRLFKVENPTSHPRLYRFLTDNRTAARVAHEDYTGSGYDRGHMAPNYAIDICYGQEAQRETFLMSNVCPQEPKLNRQVWRRLEDIEIRDYAHRLGEVWVIDGPIFDGQPKKLPGGVDIPSRFFKIVVDGGGRMPRMLAFIMNQGVEGNEELRVFLVSVDTVEDATGLDFFNELDDPVENRLEADVPSEMKCFRRTGAKWFRNVWAPDPPDPSFRGTMSVVGCRDWSPFFDAGPRRVCVAAAR